MDVRSRTGWNELLGSMNVCVCPSLYACTVWFEMFDLRVMISADILSAATRGCIRPWSGRPSLLEASNSRPQFERSVLIIHTSLPRPNSRIRVSNSISRRMGGDSSTLGCSRGNGRVWTKYAECYWERFGHYGGDRVGRRGCRARSQAREEALELEEIRERVWLGMGLLLGTR